MSDSRVRIDDHLHEKMKQLAGPERGALVREYREAIQNHIRLKTQENISRDTGLETYINNRLTRSEDRLASMMARTGIDVSMSLMGVITLLEKLLKVDRRSVQNELRKQGYYYFSNAIKEEKERKKAEKP